MLEAMAAKSKYTLQKAYYDICLEGKFMRDEESSAMLDIIQMCIRDSSHSDHRQKATDSLASQFLRCFFVFCTAAPGFLSMAKCDPLLLEGRFLFFVQISLLIIPLHFLFFYLMFIKWENNYCNYYVYMYNIINSFLILLTHFSFCAIRFNVSYLSLIHI